MSGLTIEEPVLKAGRIKVLLGQGETAQVLRNLCLIVARESTADWQRVAGLMRRLFSVELGHLGADIRRFGARFPSLSGGTPRRRLV